MKRSGEKIHFTSYDELLGVKNEENSIDIDISRIDDFEEHPFRVIDDDKMEELVESIKHNGVLTPVLVREKVNGRYEMISGHRREHAAIRAGLTQIPAIIKDLNDDEATIIMVDANIQREELLPSERAFAYKMKMEAMDRQGKRNDLTSGQNVQKLSRDKIGEEVGMSGRQVKRYISLTNLIPGLLDMVDQSEIQFTVAVEVSYLTQNMQKWIEEYIRENGILKLNQVKELRKILSERGISQIEMIQILNASLMKRESKRKITLSNKKLKSYFPVDYSDEKIEKVIYELLDEWKGNMNEI